MPKFTFTCEHEHPIKKDVNISTITYESNRDYLGDILEDFRDFLKGCGFQIDGNIDIVDEEEPETLSYNFDTIATMNDVIPTSFMSDTITITTGNV